MPMEHYLLEIRTQEALGSFFFSFFYKYSEVFINRDFLFFIFFNQNDKKSLIQTEYQSTLVVIKNINLPINL